MFLNQLNNKIKLNSSSYSYSFKRYYLLYSIPLKDLKYLIYNLFRYFQHYKRIKIINKINNEIFIDIINKIKLSSNKILPSLDNVGDNEG